MSEPGVLPFLLICLVGAPVLGLAAAMGFENPPGEGPGVLQVVAGAGVPATVSFVTARYGAKTGPVQAVGWAFASVVATGALLGLLAFFVYEVIEPR